MRRSARYWVRRTATMGAVIVALVSVPVGIWVLTHRDAARAIRQTSVIAAELGDPPIMGAIVGLLEEDVEPARVVRVGQLPATVVYPADSTPRPAVAILVPNDTSSADLAAIADVQRALARAGIAAWAVRTLDPGRSLGDEGSMRQIVLALNDIRRQPRVRSAQVSIAASGALASAALVAAAAPSLVDSVPAVIAIQPVADVQGLVRLAVTGTARGADGVDNAHPAAASLRPTAGRAIVEVIRTTLSPTSRLVNAVLVNAEARADPIAALLGIPQELLQGDLARARAVLAATDPVAFDQAWAQLPQSIRDRAVERSATSAADRVTARVLLVVPRDDRRYPAGDAERLNVALADSRLLQTELLDPDASTSDASTSISAMRAAFGASAWWIAAAGRS